MVFWDERFSRCYSIGPAAELVLGLDSQRAGVLIEPQ